MNAKTEQNSTYTPGPWLAASHPSSIVGWPVVAQSGRLICTIATPPKNIDRIGKAKEEYDAFMAECGANARLIAAAPDLLAALNSIAVGKMTASDAAYVAKTAIAKAVQS